MNKRRWRVPIIGKGCTQRCVEVRVRDWSWSWDGRGVQHQGSGDNQRGCQYPYAIHLCFCFWVEPRRLYQTVMFRSTAAEMSLVACVREDCVWQTNEAESSQSIGVLRAIYIYSSHSLCRSQEYSYKLPSGPVIGRYTNKLI